MQIRTLVTFAVIGIMLVVGAQPLLAVTNIINTSNNQFLQQAFATHMETATSNEKTVVHKE